jgi:hypothetical protein
MMDDFEKKECLKILDLLTLDNLLSLTDTVTGRVVTVENKEGMYIYDYMVIYYPGICE